jgi:hypothetical protein
MQESQGMASITPSCHLSFSMKEAKTWLDSLIIDGPCCAPGKRKWNS